MQLVTMVELALVALVDCVAQLPQLVAAEALKVH
jgi:hypothetical protein